AQPARACSGPPLEYAVQGLDIIAEGRFTDWEEALDIPAPPWGSTPIRVHFAVSRVYKGTAPADLTFVDIWSLTRRNGSDAWIPHTSCPNPFPSDPTGKAGIVGVRPDGQASPFVIFFGDSLSGEQYRQTVATLVAALPPGGGPPSARALGATVPIAAGILIATLGTALLVFPARGSRV
ncbi:MAG TPA: hypothetical protein VFP63_07390, partial [Dehalococcoidia bacterium]|nr:hypothetical protein [Dehalococcoidia bacterium]